MSPLIYDVAVSIDGYISGPNDDISRFPSSGAVLDDNFQRLSGYQTCLMGRATYEFGYAYGLSPGANPYPHMRSIIFSKTINLPDNSDIDVIRNESVDYVRTLKSNLKHPIYLCRRRTRRKFSPRGID